MAKEVTKEEPPKPISAKISRYADYDKLQG